ncbi:zf-HC2 domain-containing protein [candidate division WOR-3 bacterium]|nr:zf-HC2 domain-containing protein [candidate division WOR-3 bacterium]
MNCNNCNRMLSRYLDRELDQGRASELEEHLARCPACRDELARLAADAEGLRTLESAGPSPFLVTRVMAEVRLSRRSRRPAWARAMATTAALLLVAGGAFAGIRVGTSLAGNGETTDEMLVSADETFAGFTESLLMEDQ